MKIGLVRCGQRWLPRAPLTWSAYDWALLLICRWWGAGGGALVCKLGWIECAVCASLLCASIASLITVPYGAPSPHTLCLALGPPKNPRPLFLAAFPAPQAPFFWPPSLFSGVQEVFLAAALAPTLPLRLLLTPITATLPPSCHSKLVEPHHRHHKVSFMVYPLQVTIIVGTMNNTFDKAWAASLSQNLLV